MPMPRNDVERLLHKTKRRSRQLRNRRRFIGTTAAVAVAAAVTIPTALLAGSSSRQGVIISPPPPNSTPSSISSTTAPAVEIAVLPDVVGETVDTAEAKMLSAGVGVGFAVAPSSSVPPGSVIAQAPPPGTRGSPLTTATLTLSIGPLDVPGTGPCRAVDLKAEPGTQPVSEATNQRTFDWSFMNVSSATCYLYGYGTVTALDSAGRTLDFTVSHGDQETTAGPPAPVFLAPGSQAWLRFNREGCALPAPDRATTTLLEPPAGGGRLRLATRFDYCPSQTGGTVIAVSPFEPVELLLSGGTQPPNAALSPASVPPVSDECSLAVTQQADGNVAPLLCPGGGVNVLAWQHYQSGFVSGHPPAWSQIMALGATASAIQVLQAMCTDRADIYGTNPLTISAEHLAAAYYGWNFTTNDPASTFPTRSCV